jgi:hypothetical protein
VALLNIERKLFVRLHPFAHTVIAGFCAIVLFATVAAGPLGTHPTAADFKSLIASGPERDKVLTKVLGAHGTITSEYTPPSTDFPVIGETTIDLGSLLAAQGVNAAGFPPPTAAQQCAAGTIPPEIFKAKGKLTSEGYLVLEGACFGNSGTVELGGFPNGDPKVTTEAWTPTAITVQLPKITGVNDLTMHVQVKRTLSSKVFDAPFTAAIGDPIDLPFADIVTNECAGSGICAPIPSHSALGIHADPTNTNGADIWTLDIPKHFKLDSIKVTHISSGNTSTSTINGSGNQKTIKITWDEHMQIVNVPVTTSSTSNNGTSWDSIFEDAVSGGAAAAANQGTTTTTTTTLVPTPVYTEVYKLEATVRGPDGLKP